MTSRIRICAVFAVALAILLAWTASRRMSVTIDEFQALPAGLAILETGALRFPQGTPYLSEVLPAIPAYLRGARVGAPAGDATLSAWGLSHEVATRMGPSFLELFDSARLVSLFFLFLTLAFTYGYATDLYGEEAALLAVSVAGLCPNLLGHGALVTPDIYLAAATVGFLLSLDRLSRNPGPGPAIALALSLACAALVKFTGLLYFPLAFILAAIARPSSGRKHFFRWLLASLFLGFLLIHAAYGFGGSFRRLGDSSFVAPALRWLQDFLPGSFPLLFPREYLHGLDEQLSEPAYLAYLAGSFNQKGFFSYYLVAFLVKTPLATSALAVLAWVARPKPRRREAVYLAFSAALFVFFSLARHKNIGLRYLLFLYPVLAVWVSRLLAETKVFLGRLPFRKVALTLWLCLLAGSALTWPDYIAYFNVAAGGEGHRYLLDSNLDWGQGLIELRDFLAANHVDRISLAYAGRVRPEFYGIQFDNFDGGRPTSDVVAISANLLWGRGYFVNGTSYWPRDPESYVRFRTKKPWAVLGSTIYVYKM